MDAGDVGEEYPAVRAGVEGSFENLGARGNAYQ
jgi:hypothetical protein